MSPALCRTNSSGQRSSPPTRPSSESIRWTPGRHLRQTPGSKCFGLPHEAEGTRRRQVPRERVGGDVVAAGLATDERVRPLDGGRQPEPCRPARDVGRIALGQLEGRGDPVDHRIAGLVGDAGLLQGREIRLNEPSPIGGSGSSSSTTRSSSWSAAVRRGGAPRSPPCPAQQRRAALGRSTAMRAAPAPPVLPEGPSGGRRCRGQTCGHAAGGHPRAGVEPMPSTVASPPACARHPVASPRPSARALHQRRQAVERGLRAQHLAVPAVGFPLSTESAGTLPVTPLLPRPAPGLRWRWSVTPTWPARTRTSFPSRVLPRYPRPP